jgi:hypothetical protein
VGDELVFVGALDNQGTAPGETSPVPMPVTLAFYAR